MSAYSRTAVGLTLSAALIVLLSPAATQAQSSVKPAGYVGPTTEITDISAQQRRRVRVRVYPTDRPLSSTATRQCRAWYVQEYRASGTVVSPRMQCWWDNG